MLAVLALVDGCIVAHHVGCVRFEAAQERHWEPKQKIKKHLKNIVQKHSKSIVLSIISSPKGTQRGAQGRKPSMFNCFSRTF